MTEPFTPLRLPGMGRGIRWSDIAEEIERDADPELPVEIEPGPEAA